MPSNTECSEGYLLPEYSCPGCGYCASRRCVQGREEAISEELRFTGVRGGGAAASLVTDVEDQRLVICSPTYTA